MVSPLRRLIATSALLLSTSLLAAGGEPSGQVLDGGVNPGYHEPPAWFKNSFLDLTEDLAEASAQGRQLMLYFQQDGCPYCSKLLSDNFGDEAIASYTQAHYDTLAINIWGDREMVDLQGHSTTEKAFAATLRVQYTPTLLLLDQQGRVALRINGYYPPERFRLALAYARGSEEGVLPDERLGQFIARRGLRGTESQVELPEGLFMSPPYLLDRSRIQAQQPLLVLFEGDECSACAELHRDVLTRPEIQRLLNRFDAVRLARGAQAPLITPQGKRTTIRGWADELGVEYTPTLVMFDEQGSEAFRVEAYLRPFHYAAAMRYVLEGVWRTEPNFQRFVQAVADEMRERGEEVELWE